jgi:hypothetical protein
VKNNRVDMVKIRSAAGQPRDRLSVHIRKRNAEPPGEAGRDVLQSLA